MSGEPAVPDSKAMIVYGTLQFYVREAETGKWDDVYLFVYFDNPQDEARFNWHDVRLHINEQRVNLAALIDAIPEMARRRH